MPFSSSLLVTMFEWMSVIATTAFILSQTKVFQRLIKYRTNYGDKLKLILLFALLAIFSTYTGIPVHDALANSRVIGAMTAGLLGGPAVGGAAGLIAGIHRYCLGGFSAFACAISTTAEGILGGLFRLYYRERPIPWPVALAAGVCGETLQMLIILAVARPFQDAWGLIQAIAVPMITVNPAGIAIFIVIVNNAIEQHSRIGAVQAQKALHISTQTLPYLRQGLTPYSAENTAAIIHGLNEYAAVSITDQQTILAHIGAGSDHHIPRTSPLTLATKEVLKTGLIQTAATKREIGCNHPGCTLGSAVIVPLKHGQQVIGALKLYHTAERCISPLDMELASGLAHLFSTQLELAEIDRQSQLAAHAEMRALQAQINPHFLFNTLNTISSLIRTRPETARDIIIKLSTFFRHSMQKSSHTIPLSDELTQVNAYLSIEQARFGDKLAVTYNIDPRTETVLIPPFTIQPLVENAIKHGLQPKESGGAISITSRLEGADAVISIADDGVGMDPAEQELAEQPRHDAAHTGIGLYNVRERLKGIFGKNYGLTIDSTPGAGSTMHIRIPLLAKKEGDLH
ncbi:sensor histidine kinase [Acetonema longum]|uniref:histidine kinase n=1 Tax=Acetonema longum DSM 6540 TaxID=1009370 RepID=F7NHU1_9FIRM|nr:sensor histidine kinase [Acetonema longum]EGO64466.1 histidine kinase internal region [Acetonema longum DSM 6540]